MKKKVTLGLFLLFVASSYSQITSFPSIDSLPAANDLSTNIDMLAAPQSPAFTLLGISPTAIDRPSTPADLMVSLQNATKNYSVIPNSYSVEFTPLMFVPKYHSYNTPLYQYRTPQVDKDNKVMIGANGRPLYGYSSQGLQNQLKTNIIQTTLLSIGFAGSNTTPSYPRLGIGIKTSLATGHVSDNDRDSINGLYKQYHNAYVSAYSNQLDKDSVYQKYRILRKAYVDSAQLYRLGKRASEVGHSDAESQRRLKGIKDSINILEPIEAQKRKIDTAVMNEIKEINNNPKANNSEVILKYLAASFINDLNASLYSRMANLRHLDSTLNTPYKIDLALSEKYDSISRIYDSLMNQADAAVISNIQTQSIISSAAAALKNYNAKLVGFKCDVGGGIVLDYPASRLDSAIYISRWGLWVNAGYEGKKAAFFGAIRALGNNRDSVMINSVIQIKQTANFDVGGRFMWFPLKQLAVSVELLARATFCEGMLPMYQARYMFIAEYVVSPNNVLSFNVGKDFNNTLKNNGNVVAALNLALGFGSKRTLPGSRAITQK